jgi:hypothetical protein
MLIKKRLAFNPGMRESSANAYVCETAFLVGGGRV